MSDALRIRWILKYFTDIAQTHGGNLLNVPEFPKTQRVQIIQVFRSYAHEAVINLIEPSSQFITFPRDDYPDDLIWARISDKEFSIPVKFTSKAVSEYNVYDQRTHCQSNFLLTQKTMQIEERIQRSGIPTHEKTIRARDSGRIQALLRTNTSE